MGFSYTKLAGDTLNRIENHCLNETQMQNTFFYKDEKYFVEWDRKDADGGIEGEVFHYVDENQVVPFCSVKIESNGTIIHGMDFFKEFNDPDNYKKLCGMKYAAWRGVDHWIAVTGVDPRCCIGVIVDDLSCCYWTKEAENRIQ